MPNPIQALQALERHLVEQREHGVDRVFLSEEAIADLQALPAAVAAASPKPAEPVLEAAPPPARSTRPEPLASESHPASPTRPAAGAKPDPDAKRARLREIAIRAKRCAKTRALGSLRDQFVFAIGNPDADLMLIGEAPGAAEEQKHEPFVGPAGKLLDRIIGAMGFERGQIYISNIVKFRPSIGDADQGPGTGSPPRRRWRPRSGTFTRRLKWWSPR